MLACLIHSFGVNVDIEMTEIFIRSSLYARNYKITQWDIHVVEIIIRTWDCSNFILVTIWDCGTGS